VPYQPGEVLLDKYRIEALIGQGAFGVVYYVTHLGLNSPRAIKVFRLDRPGVGGEFIQKAQERFAFEAMLGDRLNHPNIIRVYDFEKTEDELCLVMEYAEGGSLDQRIHKASEEGHLIPVDEVIQIALEIAQGLAAIHAIDAVHRDLTPRNILFDNQGHVKIADLGLVQMRGGPSMRSRLSQPAPHPGTPGYMSLEQEKERGYLSPASDIYTLGLLIFEMLTNHIYRSQRPGTRTRDLRPDTPDWLDNLIARMLADEPRNRPWNGAEVANLLREGMAGEEIRRKEEAARREVEEKARREEQTRQQRAADEKARRETEERARREAEAKARHAAEEQARRKVEERARRAAEQRARPRLEKPFLIAGGILAVVVFLATACLAVYELIILPQQKTATAAQEVTIQAQNAQVAQAMTQTVGASWLPTHTPNPPLPLIIVSPTPIIAVSSSPADFIATYYGTINNGDYQSAWSMLSQHFKDTNNKSGYQPYADWWRTIREVEIISITVNYQNADYAGLSVELSCYFTNGNVDTYDLMEFTLKWDSSRGQWFIDDGRLVKGTR